MKKFAIALVLSVAATLPADAAPNWLGMTGLLQVPTADSLNAGQWNVGFHHIADTLNFAVGNVGLARGLEAGVVVAIPVDDGGDTEVTGHVKYQLLPPTPPEGTALAVGWWDFADEIDSTPYGVASRQITTLGGQPLRGHLGIAGGVFDSIFVGADLPLTANLLAMAEWDGEDINAGIRWGLPQGLRIDAGIIRTELAIGASYNAGF